MRLVLAAAVVNAIAGFYPQLRYGVVVVAIICLQPGIDPLEGAWERAVSIVIGAGAGAACAFAMWPQSAKRRVLRSVQRALDDCAELLDASLRRVLGDDARIDPLHGRFLQHVGNAREQLASVRRKADRHDHLEQLVHAAERLWHALIMLDRLTRPGARWAPPAGSALHAELHRVRQQACRAVRALAQALRGELPPRDPALEAAVQRAQSLSLQADTDDRDGRLAAGGRAATLAFALGEMADNLGEVRHAAARLAS